MLLKYEICDLTLLTDDKIVGLSKFKAFADDDFSVVGGI